MHNLREIASEMNTTAVSRRNFVINAAGISGVGLLLGPNRAALAYAGPPLKPTVVLNANTQAGGEPANLSRADVVRFARIASLMNPQQLQLPSDELPSVGELPPQLTQGLTAEERKSATLLLAWMSRWQKRHEQPHLPTASADRSVLAPVPLHKRPLTSVPGWLPRHANPPHTKASNAGSQSDSSKLQELLCARVEERLAALERMAQQALQDASGSLAQARSSYETSARATEQGTQEQACASRFRAQATDQRGSTIAQIISFGSTW